jgi:hypothetical protein
MREERTTTTAARTARPRLVGVTSKFKELRSPMITADGSSESAEIEDALRRKEESDKTEEGINRDEAANETKTVY